MTPNTVRKKTFRDVLSVKARNPDLLIRRGDALRIGRCRAQIFCLWYSRPRFFAPPPRAPSTASTLDPAEPFVHFRSECLP